jgi:hypothetical protein
VAEGPAHPQHHLHPPRIHLTRKQIVASLIFVAAVIAFLYFGLPKLAGLGTT